MKIRNGFSFLAFALGLSGLFLQQFYRYAAVTAFIHIIDFSILALIIAETFLPIRKEKYIRKYFQKNAADCFSTLVFCILCIYFKIKTGRLSEPQDFDFVFSIFKNIFLFGRIIGRITYRKNLTKKIVSNPAQTLMFSFLTVIIAGTLLLMLPQASVNGSRLTFLKALFTAASAVCVTGLSIIDVSTELTLTGKIILISLIQTGGLGIMVFSFFGMLAFRKKLSVADKMTVSYLVSEDDMSGLFGTLKVIVFSTFLIEAVSALFLFIGFSHKMGFGIRAAGFAAFHSVSAFCNAGFALFSDNLESFTADPVINLTIGFTILLGGISFAVIYDLTEKIKAGFKNIFLRKKTPAGFLSLNTKVVLSLTAVIFSISFCFFYLLEHANTMKTFSLGTQYLASFFQAVTLRTAGFSTVPFSSLGNSTLLFMIFIMFIGGAAGSTAGGIKLNTAAVVIAFFKSFLNNQKTVVIKNNAVPEEQVKKAFLIFGFGLGIICAGIFILTITEKLPFLPLVFETVSAFATVGLSAGITGALSNAGKIVIIFLMFIGRVGPLTILTAAGKTQKDNDIEYSYGNINIG